MASSSTQPSQQRPPSLSSIQQDLLLAALNSRASGKQNLQSAAGYAVNRSDSDSAKDLTMSALNRDGLFMSPQDAGLDSFDYIPELEYMDGNEFDFENADLGGDMIGALPEGAQKESHGDGHEKRKSPDEDSGALEGDAKRQETGEGEKSAKKPGRKPLTTEPTTKRKAQNRAAQRAFRERKEAHLKDLEQKVLDLTKTQEADKQENGMLKAQVERLQIELREYRKRLSLNSSSVRSSPPLNPVNTQQRSVSGTSYGNNFQFDFPKFGALPGSQLFRSQGMSDSVNSVNKEDSTTPPMTQSPSNFDALGQPQPQSQSARQNSMGRSQSPRNLYGNGSNWGSPQNASVNLPVAPYSTNDNMHGFASTLPQMHSGSGTLGDLFSPNLLKSANVNGYFNNNNTTNTSVPTPPSNYSAESSRVFQFNRSSTASDSTSPSASSSSQWNANGTGNSSCGTSPEPSQPSHDSPALKDKAGESFGDKTNLRKQSTELPFTMNQQLDSQTGMNAMFGFGTTDYSNPSLASFDPVLFGDYRDTNDAILGGGDFSGGFFDDALNPNPYDYNSPSNLFGILQSPQQADASLSPGSKPAEASTPSRNLMAEVEKTCAGGDEDYGLPTTQSKETASKFISCNTIWNQLQSNPDFQEGKFDLDGLCSELRAKAKCSESGVMVDQDHVHMALKKLGQKDHRGKAFEPPNLLFEQDSWNNVLKKMQSGSKA